MENNVLKNSEEDNKDADSIMKKYKELFEKFQGEIIQSYRTKPLLRFLYGPLFLSVIEKIKKEKEITFLLKAISNVKICELPEKGKHQIPDDSKFSDIFNV